MEQVGCESVEAGNFSSDTGSTRLWSCEVHEELKNGTLKTLSLEEAIKEFGLVDIRDNDEIV